jgi:tetratricopeptide (TPR) repeat protein
MTVFICAALPVIASPNKVRRINGEGNRLYTEDEWAEALETYREAAALDPQNPVLHYNLGNALFRLNDLDQAETHYRVAAAAEDGDLARQARFNLGNTAFRQAETLEGAGDWQGRNQALAKAIEQWKSVLEGDPANRDAKRNLELAWRKLREPPPENQQQQQDEQQNGEEEEQNQEQQQEGEQGEQEQDQQQEQQQPSEEGDDEQKEQSGQQEQPQPGQEQQEVQQQPQAGEQEQDQQAGEEREARISGEEAQRILDALRDEEMEEQRRQMAERKAKGGSAAKDW